VKLELVDPFTPEAEQTWKSLEQISRPAYFLTWAWISNWLACLPRAHVPWLAIVVAAGAPLAAFFLAKRTMIRSRVMPSRSLFFNTTGVQRHDTVWLEYNGLVGHALTLGELLPLVPRGWDELYLPALREDAFADISATADNFAIVESTVPAPYVDLAAVRAKGYLPLLSGQTRGQVRRAQREAGALEVEVARDPLQALDIYSELTSLHTAQWRAKGKPGAFADPWFDRFHRRLIRDRFAHGEIQLLRARNAAGPIGCLYNFVHDGRVLQYQSGFQTFSNDRMKPGFICHTAAIEHAAAAGHDVYDFLAGGQRYKKQLSTDATMMTWARVQRRRLRFWVEDHVRRWRAQRG
jgi:CelD/BcsL family acetyltransferase involved in cellulose biosynthesis